MPAQDGDKYNGWQQGQGCHLNFLTSPPFLPTITDAPSVLTPDKLRILRPNDSSLDFTTLYKFSEFAEDAFLRTFSIKRKLMSQELPFQNVT